MSTNCPNCNSIDTEPTGHGPRRCNDCALLFTKNGTHSTFLGPDPQAVQTRE